MIDITLKINKYSDLTKLTFDHLCKHSKQNKCQHVSVRHLFVKLSRQIEHCVSGVEGRPVGLVIGISISTVDNVDTVSSSSDDNSTTPLIGSDFMTIDMLNRKFQF